MKSADGSNEIVSQIGFIVESADGLTMNFMKVLSRLQVLRRGASRSYTSHYFQYLSVQSDRKTSLPCRDKPIFMKYSTFKAIFGKIIYADTGTRALSIK